MVRTLAKCWVAATFLHTRFAAIKAYSPFKETILSDRPLIISLEDFASAEECAEVEALVHRCHNGTWEGCKEQRSKLHATASSGAKKVQEPAKPLRNSSSFTLTLQGEMEDVMDTMVRRAHRWARHPINHGEGIQVAYYQSGEYYGFHHDSLMRRATVILYLNDVPEGDGGETIFPLIRAPGIPDDMEPPLPSAVQGRDRPRLDFKVEKMLDSTPYCESDFYLKIRPKRGMAVMFFSYGPDYAMDEHAIHAACALKRGHKAIFQRWMRFDKNSLYEKEADSIQRMRNQIGRERLLKPDTTSAAPETTAGAVRSVLSSHNSHRGGGLSGAMPPPPADDPHHATRVHKQNGSIEGVEGSTRAEI